MLPTDPRTVLISAVCGLVLGIVGGWCINGWRLGAEIGSLETASAGLRATIATERATALTNARDKEHANAIKLEEVSKTLRDTEAKNAQLETDRNAAIAAGTQRVHVRAICPGIGDMPASATAASGVNGTSVELDPAYRSTLSDLRRGTESDAAKIIGLQEYARSCQKLANGAR